MRASPLATLVALVVVFAPLSLVSIGGATAVLAEIEHQAVVVRHWTSAGEFADFFALSRAAPGPGSLLVALIGWNVAGLAGALVAAGALFLPSTLLAYGAARLWERWRGSSWHEAVERGLAPIAAGLILAGGLAVLRVAPHGALGVTVVIAATALLWRWPRLHPLLVLAAAGALFGLLG
jgi:chromate transporter